MSDFTGHLSKPSGAGSNGATGDQSQLSNTNYNEVSGKAVKQLHPGIPISPSNSSTQILLPKGIMNTSGTSGAIVSNSPSGIRKVPTVTFSDPKKVIVTPLQQHIQQHKEQQRELKEQKEQLKVHKNGSASNDEINSDMKRIQLQKQRASLETSELGAGILLESNIHQDSIKGNPVTFQMASPAVSSVSLQSSNVNSFKDIDTQLEAIALKDPFLATEKVQGTQKIERIFSPDTNNIKFQLPKRSESFKESQLSKQHPLATDSLTPGVVDKARSPSIEFEMPSKLSNVIKRTNSLSLEPATGTISETEKNKETCETATQQNDLLNLYGKDSVKNIHPSLPLDDGRLHVLLGACGSLSVLKLKMLIKKLEDVYGGQKKVAIQVIVTGTAEKLLFKRHQERQLMKEQKELKAQKMSFEQQQKDETPELPVFLETAGVKVPSTPTALNSHSLDLPQHIKVWKDSDEWDVWQSRTDPVLHIELRRWADILVVAPMTANTLSKIALGLCDNLLTNVIRAWNPSSPILLAPSMVSQSYNSVITKRHLKFIKEEMPWVTVFKPAEKIMGVHGDIGLGGMMDPHEIVNKIVKELGISDDEEEDESDEDEDEDDNDLKAEKNKINSSDYVVKEEKKSPVSKSLAGNRVTLKKDATDYDDDSDDYDEDDEDEEDEMQIMDEEEELDEFEIEQKEKEMIGGSI
ncbi:hypothetical protein QEN19_002238 [Hanseniaspora menglaensis]